jgi:hypothetical protein
MLEDDFSKRFEQMLKTKKFKRINPPSKCSDEEYEEILLKGKE